MLAFLTYRKLKPVVRALAMRSSGKIADVLGCDFDELMLTARRLPQDLMDTLASDPQGSLRYLRQWLGDGS